MKVLKRFWKSLAAFGGLLGLFYAPLDLEGWRDAAQPWTQVVTMLEREFLAVSLAIIALGYIIWMDLRPLLKSAFIRQMIQAGRVEARSRSLKIEGQTWYQTAYFLPITNVTKEARSLLNVRANLITFLDRKSASFESADGKNKVNIASGETVYIFIGQTLEKNYPRRSVRQYELTELESQQIEMFVKNAEHGNLLLFSNNVWFIPILRNEKYETPDYWVAVQVLFEEGKSVIFRLAVSADDSGVDLEVENLKGEVVEPQDFLKLAEEKQR